MQAEQYVSRKVLIRRLVGDRYRIVKCFQIGCGKLASVEVEMKQDGSSRIKREFKCGACFRRWVELQQIEIEFD